jgi:hypothetical protein
MQRPQRIEQRLVQLMENDLDPVNAPQLQRRHVVLIVITLLVIAVAIIVGLRIHDEEPNYYAPGRAPLVNAKRTLAESIHHENVLIKERRVAHDEISSAINYLAAAENLDRADRNAIEVLRSRLAEIELADRQGDVTQNELHEMYNELFEQMDVLIKRLEKYPQ